MKSTKKIPWKKILFKVVSIQLFLLETAHTYKEHQQTQANLLTRGFLETFFQSSVKAE